LILISKSEAEIIRKELPNTFITTTCKPKKADRKKRYMEENRASIALIRKIRAGRYVARG
jgi:hypothetical protein